MFVHLALPSFPPLRLAFTDETSRQGNATHGHSDLTMDGTDTEGFPPEMKTRITIEGVGGMAKFVAPVSSSNGTPRFATDVTL